MKDIPEQLARQMIAEYKEVRQTKFWEYLMECYEEERRRAKDNWETTETGTMASPLMEKWLRLQGIAQAFKKAQLLPIHKIQELENLVNREE